MPSEYTPGGQVIQDQTRGSTLCEAAGIGNRPGRIRQVPLSSAAIASSAIQVRTDRLECGLLGDHKPVGDADRGALQREAAKRFGITQPRLNDVLRGRIDKFSLDALVNMLAHAGMREVVLCHITNINPPAPPPP